MAPVPVRIRLGRKVIPVCHENARLAFIGGRTSVRSDPLGDERRADQLVGQFGEAALSAFLYGSLEPYYEERARRNANPTVGDDGDLGLNLDVKTSLMRGSPVPLDYRLIVPPKEVKRARVYMLGLVPEIDVSPIVVYLVGWLREWDLPRKPVGVGRQFAGKFVVEAPTLNPRGRQMTPFEWERPATVVEAPLESEINW